MWLVPIQFLSFPCHHYSFENGNTGARSNAVALPKRKILSLKQVVVIIFNGNYR